MTAIVVTNGHWATTENVAFGKLSSLRDAGLTWIQISLDDQHQEVIPYDRVSNVVKAARALNFADIKIIGSSKGNSENFKYQLFYLQNVLGVDIDEIDLLDRPRVSHQHYTDSNQKRYPVADFVNEAEHLLPKPDCLNEMMIDVNGDVYPCCNNFVGRIGNISTNTLESTLKNARENRYCKLIGNGGPLNLALHLDRAFKTNYGSQHYSTWCEVCAQMFQNETVKDLLLR